jgi:Trk K+ transport system NAD-binding subunit
MNRPVILCGAGKVGRRVLDCLLGDALPVVVIDRVAPPDLPANVRFIAGDCRNRAVLLAAGITSARGMIACTSDDLVNMAAALAARSLSPEVRIVVRAFNPRLVPRLGPGMADVVALSVSGLVSPLLALLARTGAALGGFAAGDGLRTVVERRVAGPATLNEIAAGDVPIAWSPREGPPRFFRDLSGAERLAAGDRLVVCARASADSGEVEVRWGSWVRRQWLAVVRTVGQVERLVLLTLAILLAVMTASTLVYHFVNGEPIADAVHHTVNVIATSSTLRAERYGTFMKWFESGLRLTGTALVAAFTAALTNYWVRARLGGALEVLRIPDQGHVVVCGLGNIGFRVVEELLRGKQPVVVIDAAPDNRFLASARRLGAAVIAGDCTLPDALRQARADTARAVVAVTDSDLVNIETALVVRELNAEQRVVVRLTDADLATTLREAASVRHAVAVPALAAPAFAAALFGDRVQAVFLAAGRLFAAVEIHVEEGETQVEGTTVGELARRWSLQPIDLTPPAADMTAHRLAPGDRLTAVIALTDLDRMYRREPAA